MTQHCALPNSPLAEERAGIDACVHCGFCLQACPTYLTLEDENDSPRGRIVLMRSLVEGTLPPDNDTVHTHIARCLGCRACETACPSGVPYGQLLEATRATLSSHRTLPLIAKLILWVMKYPLLLRPAMSLARLLAATPLPTLAAKLPSSYGFAMAMLASSDVPVERGSYEPEKTDDHGSAALLEGCIMEGLFHPTNRATERVLTHNGYTMVHVSNQRCCGALHLHAGDMETARQLARKNIAAFERTPTDYIVSNSAGCGAMLKEYGHLLHHDPVWSERAQQFSAKVRDVSELLVQAGPKIGGPLPFRVTYDAPCHLHHAQRVTAAPMEVLEAIPGLTLVPLAGSDRCCGSAGIYSLVEPETSDAVLESKLADIHSTGATLVATGNPGCLLQIGAGLHRSGMQTRAIHPVDLLDASYAAL
jgi:glycolate oxidase iron-sulfur subunit